MSNWKKARKKPIVIEFREVDSNLLELSCHPFFGTMEKDFRDPISYRTATEVCTTSSRHIVEKEGWGRIRNFESLPTAEGGMRAYADTDYIIRGVDGELYPIKKTIFEKTYEVLDDES